MKVERKRIGDLFDVKAGGTPSRSRADFYGGRIPWVKISDMLQGEIKYTEESITELGLENSGAKLLPKGTLLISIFATVGRTAELGIDATTNQAIVGLVPKTNGFDKKYIRCYLDFKAQSLKDISRGVAQNNINKSILSDIEIPLPALKTQQKIASILEQADAARQKRKQANQLTEQFLQSAFLEMFGDPVRNEKGWEVKLIENISTKVSSGSTPLGGASVYQDKGITFIRSQNVLMNKFDYSDVAFISGEIHNSMKRTWLKTNDVLINITGASIGRTAVYKGENDKANVNQHVCIIRSENKKVNPDFLSFLISIPTFQDSINANNSGATRQAFNFEQIKNFKIPLPPLPLQQKFATLVGQVEQLRTKQRESERELENLFGSLMQRYFGNK